MREVKKYHLWWTPSSDRVWWGERDIPREKLRCICLFRKAIMSYRILPLHQISRKYLWTWLIYPASIVHSPSPFFTIWSHPLELTRAMRSYPHAERFIEYTFSYSGHSCFPIFIIRACLQLFSFHARVIWSSEIIGLLIAPEWSNDQEDLADRTFQSLPDQTRRVSLPQRIIVFESFTEPEYARLSWSKRMKYEPISIGVPARDAVNDMVARGFIIVYILFFPFRIA